MIGLKKFKGGREIFFVFIHFCPALINLLYNKEVLFCIINKYNKEKVECKNIILKESITKYLD